MMLTRTIALFAVVLSALFLPVWVFGSAALLYAFWYSPLELLGVGVLIDATFGYPAYGTWYLYTLTTALITLAVTVVRPYLNINP